MTSDFEILTELGRKEIQDRGIKAVINWDHLRKQKPKNSQEDNQVNNPPVEEPSPNQQYHQINPEKDSGRCEVMEPELKRIKTDNYISTSA